MLANFFVSRFGTEMSVPNIEVAPAAMKTLHDYSWPGNVRELKNVLERAIILCAGPRIAAEHLPREITRGAAAATPGPAAVGPLAAAGDSALAAVLPGPDEAIIPLEEVERRYILEALRRCDDNRSKTATVLGISRSTLIEKIKKYGLGG